MSDGEYLALLVGAEAASGDFRQAVYAGLLRLQDGVRRAQRLGVVILILAVLAKFDALRGFTAAGVAVEAAVFDHIALTGLGVAAVYASMESTKASFLGSWFAHQYEQADAGGRARLLLKYPEAFDISDFFPTSVGWPAYIFPRRSLHFYMLSFAIMILVFGLYILGVGWLWASLAADVWASHYPSRLVSGATILASALLAIVSLAIPNFGIFKKKYVHYGLATRLASLEKRNPERHRSYLRRLIAINQGAVPPPPGAGGA